MTRTMHSRDLSLALVALIACSYSIWAQESATNTTTGDEAAIRENVRQMETGWNMKSGTLFAKPFAVDADYVIINGTHIKGQEVIGTGHQRIFDTIFKESTLSLAVKQIRFLRPDIAIVHVSGHNQIRQGEKTSEGDAIITLVLVKTKGEWKIAAFQNTEIRSSAQ